MLSDVPNASWHPALMPNSTADLTPQATTSSPAQHRVEEDRVLPATNTEQTQDDQHERLGSESWLPDAGANGNWMEGGAENAPAAVPEEPESSTVARHSARMSFARTVSHEVNWNDDDDVDWDLPQTGTDPSKFLPDTGRTNSFPPAPPLQQEPSHELEQPLPANQTEELLREIEQEENEESMAFPDGTSGSISANASGYPDGQVTGDNSDSHRYADGGFNGTRDDAQQARYEEGVPLMSSTDNAAAQVSSGDGGHDLFGDATAGEDDDFFGNVRGNPANEEDNFQPPPFERKSTMDVLNGLNMGPAGSGFVPLEGTAEETETEGGVDQPHGIQHLQTETTQPTETAENAQSAADGENLDEKWKAMFADADDEDFLPDEESEPKEVDPTAFLGSDDEGLLDESEVEQTDATDPLVTSGSQTVPSIPAVNQQYFPATTPSVPTPSTNPYLPAASPMTAATANLNPYLPASGPIAPVQPPVPSPFTASSAAPLAPAQPVYGRPPLPQEKNKAQSFADKSKGGYTSPYDLPMEVVKPKKRASTQPLRNTSAPIPSSSAMPPPPRSASSQSHPPPPSSGPHPPPPNSAPIPGMPRPGPSHSTQAATAVRKPAHESFFEELPVTTKARPASRSSHKSQPSPTQTSAYAPPPHSAPFIPPAGPPTRSEPEPDIPNLVAPPRVNPYASLTNPTVPSAVPPTTSTRYSPAPASVPHANAPVPAPASNRYSPAPSVSRQPSSSYGPAAAVPGPPLLPHMPRTSSPLAHFEISHEKSRAPAPAHTAEGSLPERRSSSSLYDSRLHKVPALPPTREVEEEEVPSQTQSSPGQAQSFQPTSPPDSRYAPLPQKARQTPPPRPLPPSTQTLLSPPKRTMSSHSPLASSYEFALPPRSQTQSPGTLYGNRTAKPADPVPRPSSANAPTSPRTSGHATAAIPPAPAPFAPTTGSSRSRGFSLNLNVIPPTDGRELDPLQRWRGAPLVSWGVGGTFITMFPKEVPRYGMNESTPSVVRSPGEVKVQNIKDITPLEERLAKFPGPLKGKSKKKETIAWLTTGIESLERGLPKSLFIHPQLSHDDKRAVERVLLWKILRLFVESDGVLEGNPTVEKAVRDILTPGLETSENTSPYSNGVTGLGLSNSLASAAPDAVNSSTVEQIRRHLLAGECEKAIWAAVDQRLWGHALLLANALAPALYKQVTQEFVKKEVNLPGYSNEPLATLYEVLSGNHEESVDELVPVHARAGLQLIAKDPVSGPSKDGLEGLDKWRETLSLILSNRSADDARAISSLGVLLSGYGRAEAAHICFMFARSHSVFGGLDDPASNFVLVGSDHQRQAEQFAKEIEPLLLSEVYEYGQSLAGGSNVPVTNPHLAAYKLQHAFALAEYGFRDKALQYCDAIAAAITSQTKRSPYHHPILENAVEDLMKRLKQAPKEESNSWIPKPNMNKVSDSVWSRFNKFVAGDDNDSSGQGSPADGETGPFARVAGGTPTISRSPSVNNLETFGAAVPSYGMPSHLPNLPAATSAPPTRAASRYAPAAPQPAGTSSKSYSSTSAYAPRSSMERTSSEMNRSSFELPRRSLELKSGNSGVYSPVRSGSPAAMYTPYSAEFSSPQGLPYHPLSQSTPPQTSARQHSVSYPDASTNGVPADSSLPTPPSSSQASRAQDQAPGTLGYQPTSYGYEPPSFNPHEAPVEDKNENSNEGIDGNSYEPPSYQPYSYEPPSYEPEPQADNGNDSGEESKPKPKKKGIMYDDEDDFPAPKPAEKTKEEKDRENAELFRKAAEEDAKRAAEAAKQTKKGWGFTSWFGVGAKKDTSQESSPNKPIRAKLGEANSFYYDPELKRWVNKNASPEDNAKIATPPPPKAAPRSSSSSPAPPRSPALSPSGGNETGRASAPPAGPPRSTSATLSPPPSGGLASSSLDSGLAAGGGAPPPGSAGMLRSVSNTSSASAPPLSAPNRPPTSLSNSSSIDDLLGAAGPRRPGAAKKPRKSARYVDVMTK